MLKYKSGVIEVSIEFKVVIELLQRAILNKHLVRFYYVSGNGNRAERIIMPYMILLEGNALKLVGTPNIELSKEISKRQPGHYKISQLEQRLQLKQFKVLSKTFSDPGVPRSIVVSTKTQPVCRFIYDDEDSKKVKAERLKIKYVK